MIRKTFFIAAAVALVSAVAHAENRPSITIKIDDLNLASPKDVDRLSVRVIEAAGELCGLGRLAVFVTGPPPEFLACRDRVADAALSQLNAPLVVALREKIKARGAQ